MSGPFTTITVNQFHAMQDSINAADRLAVALTAAMTIALIPGEGLGLRIKDALAAYEATRTR